MLARIAGVAAPIRRVPHYLLDSPVRAAALLLLAMIVLYPLTGVFRLLEVGSTSRLIAEFDATSLANSLLAATLATVFSGAIGVPLAWLCARTDLPGRGFVTLLVSVSFVLPTLLTSIAYVLLLSKNAGLVNVALAGVLGGPLYNIYSFSGVVFISVLHSYSLVFFAAYAGLKHTNAELEEAGRACGLRPTAVFFRITLATMLPSVLAGLVFVFAETLTMLSAPLVLAAPVGIPFVTTDLYGAIVMNPSATTAIMMSLPLVVATLVVIYFQNRLVGGGRASRFATVSGKGARQNNVALEGRWKFLALCWAWVPIALSLIAPVAVLALGALSQHWWEGPRWSNLTLANLTFLVTSRATVDAIANSIILAVSVGILVTMLGAVLALIVAGPDNPLKRLIRQTASVPLGIPHVVVAVLIIFSWNGPPFNLGGTLSVLVLAHIFAMLPFGMRTSEAALTQIDLSLAEAARVAGCSQLATWRHVLFPLMRHGLAATFVIVFLFSIKEFSLTAMLYGAGSKTLPVLLYTSFESGQYEKTAAASIILLLLTFGMLAMAAKGLRMSIRDLRT